MRKCQESVREISESIRELNAEQRPALVVVVKSPPVFPLPESVNGFRACLAHAAGILCPGGRAHAETPVSGCLFRHIISILRSWQCLKRIVLIRSADRWMILFWYFPDTFATACNFYLSVYQVILRNENKRLILWHFFWKLFLFSNPASRLSLFTLECRLAHVSLSWRQYAAMRSKTVM